MQMHPTQCRDDSAFPQVEKGRVPQTREQASEAMAGLDIEVIIPLDAIGWECVESATDDAFPEYSGLKPHETSQFLHLRAAMQMLPSSKRWEMAPAGRANADSGTVSRPITPTEKESFARFWISSFPGTGCA